MLPIRLSLFVPLAFSLVAQTPRSIRLPLVKTLRLESGKGIRYPDAAFSPDGSKLALVGDPAYAAGSEQTEGKPCHYVWVVGSGETLASSVPPPSNSYQLGGTSCADIRLLELGWTPRLTWEGRGTLLSSWGSLDAVSGKQSGDYELEDYRLVESKLFRKGWAQIGQTKDGLLLWDGRTGAIRASWAIPTSSIKEKVPPMFMLAGIAKDGLDSVGLSDDAGTAAAVWTTISSFHRNNGAMNQATWEEENHLFVWKVGSREPIADVRLTKDDKSGSLLISPHGHWILKVGGESFETFQADSGWKVHQMKDVEFGEMHQWFEDERHVLSVTQSEPVRIRLWNAESGQIESEGALESGQTPLAFSPDGRFLVTRPTEAYPTIQVELWSLEGLQPKP